MIRRPLKDTTAKNHSRKEIVREFSGCLQFPAVKNRYFTGTAGTIVPFFYDTPLRQVLYDKFFRRAAFLRSYRAK
jgi:hypothetical protein